nr:GGDEF domain-containing protein [Planosporangium thailandense]
MLRIHRLSRQRDAAEHALVHQATHDALTGLPNRAELLARLEAAIARERATGRPAVVLLFCDLNGFKLVNDRLGHVTGDRVLVEVANRLRAGLRSADTVARYGGDEFLVLCEDGSPATVARLRDHIVWALSAPIEIGAERIAISASVGAVTSDGLVDADELIRRADEAMYEAKLRHRADGQLVGGPAPADSGTAA